MYNSLHQLPIFRASTMQTLTCILVFFVSGIAWLSADDANNNKCWDLSIMTAKQKDDHKENHKKAWDKCCPDMKMEDFKNLEKNDRWEKTKCMGVEIGTINDKGEMNCDKIYKLVDLYSNPDFKEALVNAHKKCCETPKCEDYVACAKKASKAIKCDPKIEGCDADPDMV